MRRLRIAVSLAGVALVSGAALLWALTDRKPGQSAPSVRAPDGVRVRVQVLNGTKVRGLARRATTLLRDRGFDVVEVGTVKSSRDTTLVLDLSGHPDWAKRIAKVLAPARVETRADTSRYLDIAIVLGTTWRPPPDPFHP
ncbi:MAG TPA: LytR C-terminal domain-containing protein [Gemmatimonadaceae bacterium]